MVDVDTDLPAKHTVVQGNNPRRAGRLYSFKTDQAASPAALLASLRTFLARKAAELRDDPLVRAGQELLPPVVELYLTGVLPFDRGGAGLGRRGSAGAGSVHAAGGHGQKPHPDRRISSSPRMQR